MLQTAADAFNLNLYAFGVNPVGIVLSCGSIYPSLDFYYDGEYQTWWDKWKNWIYLAVGALMTVAACVLAAYSCGAASPLAAAGVTLVNIALNTISMTARTLAIAGVIAGVQSAVTGHDFWQGFADSISENVVDVLVATFAFIATDYAVKSYIKNFQCFKEGTLVETEEGAKPIEEIQVGDKVLAYDEETGEQEYKPVVRLFRNVSKEWVRVTVKGEEIESTPGHKYYLPESKQWVSAEDLKAGTKVLLSTGEYGIIEATRRIHYDEPQTTYNFEVEDFHTYYVGAGVCVHNQNCGFGKYYDGMEMSPDEALDAAQDFLGDGYRELQANDGTRFVSMDGMRQVRMNPGDLMGLHGDGRSHLNFDILKPKYKTIHIYLKGR